MRHTPPPSFRACFVTETGVDGHLCKLDVDQGGLHLFLTTSYNSEVLAEDRVKGFLLAEN